MQRWLMKTEPNEYSWADLEREGVTVWDGVKNFAALKNMRAMTRGDEVLIYHTGKERAVVGTGRVANEAYPDPDLDDERIVVVDIAAGKTLKYPVTLKEIKKSGLFDDWALIRQPRLSVMPVDDKQWQWIMQCSKDKK